MQPTGQGLTLCHLYMFSLNRFILLNITKILKDVFKTLLRDCEDSVTMCHEEEAR
jgi:hypothetical protein